MSKDFRQAALDYHAEPVPGKISMELTKPAETQAELALAYSPGVAEPCREIAADADAAYLYTGKGNLVAVISNGTAVLGLGNLGALASKPVMEGK
ncbi:MAG TPA: malate dehydrogenase, partial [Halieaceae bacterium]|nr:malate dehydrogenase [Halieaceae bacterium]